MIIDGQRSSDPALTVVLAYYKAFNARDWETMLSLLADDVAHDANQGARSVGKAAFRTFLARMDRCYREELRDIVVLTSPDGQLAAAEFVVHGMYRATDEGLPPARGQTYVVAGGAFFELRDGKIVRVTNYYNLQEWLRQIG